VQFYQPSIFFLLGPCIFHRTFFSNIYNIRFFVKARDQLSNSCKPAGKFIVLCIFKGKS